MDSRTEDSIQLLNKNRKFIKLFSKYWPGLFCVNEANIYSSFQ